MSDDLWGKVIAGGVAIVVALMPFLFALLAKIHTATNSGLTAARLELGQARADVATLSAEVGKLLERLNHPPTPPQPPV